jgi:dTDP-4-dehydrorhamnose reductase
VRIAVVGADGQLGTDVVAALGSHEVLRFVEPSRAGGEDATGLDVTDPEAVAAALTSSRLDWVINTAAMTNVDACETDIYPAVLVNAIGARNVATACNTSGATLIHISTDYVFDGEKDGAYLETDPPHPINVYGMSKLMGEWYVQAECAAHYIVRTSGLYGTSPCVGKGTNFVETMLRLGAERDSLTVVDDEVLTPTFTEDLAAQLVFLVDKRPPFGVYHATNAGRCSWFEFAGEIFRETGASVELSPISSSEWGAPARRPANSVLENAALSAQGCDVMPDWRDALHRYLAKRSTRP